MTGPRAERRPDGVRLAGLPPLFAEMLRTLPDLLADDGPARDGRARQDAFSGPGSRAANEEWRRLAWPEIRHLFESQRATVARDLRGLAPEGVLRRRFAVDIPAAHLPAWIGALAAARVGLADAHDLDAAAMGAEPPAPPETERDRALWTVHLLGWIQALLVEAAG